MTSAMELSASSLVDRLVRVVENGSVLVLGQAIADGTPGVLVREERGGQRWWRAEFVELDEIGVRATA